MSRSDQARSVTRDHLDCMTCLIEIDHRLSQLEAEGRNVGSYQRMLPTWMHAVLMFPGGWQAKQPKVSAHAMDSLEHLAELLDLVTPSVRPERSQQLSDLLDRVAAMLKDDDSLSDQLRRYLFWLVEETRTALAEHQTLGTFDVNGAMMRLWVGLNAAAEQSKGKKREWRGVVRDLFVGTTGGLLANVPGIVQQALGG